MKDDQKHVTWSPRVQKEKLKRLYESTCQGIWDEKLIDDVGLTLYLRCRDIINIHQAKTEMKVSCPRCLRAGASTLITREKTRIPMKCHVCGWRMTWVEYSYSFKRRQLNPGGAVKYFKDFIKSYEQAHTPKDKMMAIDRVIHEFHYSLREMPDQPTRAAGGKPDQRQIERYHHFSG